MTEKIRSARRGRPGFSVFPALMLLLFLIFSSCGKKKNEMVSSFDQPQEIPTLRTEGVSTLISDSGVTKYRIVAAEWDVYEKAKEPYWYFPKKLYVEKFDSLYQTDASIESDTAYFFKNKKLWRLVGNVKIRNMQNERFETQEMFWDQRTQRIYSDAFIHIEKADVIIEGFGFESNESITKYTIRNTSAIIPIKDTQPIRSDSIPVDSVNGGVLPQELPKDTLENKKEDRFKPRGTKLNKTMELSKEVEG